MAEVFRGNEPEFKVECSLAFIAIEIVVLFKFGITIPYFVDIFVKYLRDLNPKRFILQRSNYYCLLLLMTLNLKESLLFSNFFDTLWYFLNRCSDLALIFTNSIFKGLLHFINLALKFYIDRICALSLVLLDS